MFDINHTINSANDEDCVVLPTIEHSEHLVNVIHDVAQYNQGTVVIGFDAARCQAYGIDENQLLALYTSAQHHLEKIETRVSFIDYRVSFKLAVIHVNKMTSEDHEHASLHQDNNATIQYLREAKL